jgi:nicotinamidase-related amidase
MPLTQLDPTAALIVIDLQKGITGMPTAQPATEVIGRASQLAKAFRKRGLPVVLVNVTGRAPGRSDAGFPKFAFPPDWSDLVPELDLQPSDHLVSKQRWGAFIGTDLHEYLQEEGVTQVFVVGIATSVGVESTARSAYDHGYHVVLVTDAMTDRSEEAHRYSVDAVFPRIAEVDSTENVLKALAK